MYPCHPPPLPRSVLPVVEHLASLGAFWRSVSIETFGSGRRALPRRLSATLRGMPLSVRCFGCGRHVGCDCVGTGTYRELWAVAQAASSVMLDRRERLGRESALGAPSAPLRMPLEAPDWVGAP